MAWAGAPARGAGDSIIDNLIEKIDYMVFEQKRINVAVKVMFLILPSEDCKTDNNSKYRALMLALREVEDFAHSWRSVTKEKGVCGIFEDTF